MKQNYQDCLQRLLVHEGGYSNVPGDTGGPTNFGITIADYRKYIKPDATAADVKAMKLDDAKTIYKSKYWDALGCDNLSGGVDYTVFDYGVNSGLGRPRADLKKFKDKTGVALINAINDERQAFLTTIAQTNNRAKFLAGWTRRVKEVRARSLELAGKKDQASGPVAGVVASAGIYETFTHYIHQHPYASAAAAIAVGAFVWWVIHSIRNRNVVAQQLPNLSNPPVVGK